MDLKEGMYLRSTYGDIGKIRTHIQYWANKEEYDYVVTDNDKSFDRYSISKTSYNIIDLIEVGDYVNGSKVLYFMIDEEKSIKEVIDEEIGVVVEGNCETVNCYSEDIKSIVTKEQFESMSYYV